MDYKVIITDKPLFYDNMRAYGHISFDKHEIYIDKTLKDEQGQLQTLLHEILHGIIYDRAIEFDKMDEETIVDHLAKGIYQVLKDNKIF